MSDTTARHQGGDMAPDLHLTPHPGHERHLRRVSAIVTVHPDAEQQAAWFALVCRPCNSRKGAA
jgi:hypothetical protein